MQEKFAVFMTLNGEIVEWRVFDSHHTAYEHYNQGIEKLRGILKETDEGDWQIMLCNINQYAVSKPQSEPTSSPQAFDWHTKYSVALANQAKKFSRMPSNITLQAWRALRKGMSKTIPKKKTGDGSAGLSGA